MTNEINVNQDVVLIPSQTVASANPDTSPDQVNLYAAAALFFFNITSASGTGGLTFNLQCKDPVSGNYATVFSGNALTSTGMRTYYFSPGGLGTLYGLTGGMAICVPRTWRVQITKGDSSSYTYSVGSSLIKT